MKSFDLTFELYYDLRFFQVNFDTKGPHENLLMSIYMDGYPIDTVFLPATHKILNAMIETKMRSEAEKFWNERSQKAFGKLSNMTELATKFFNIKTV